MVDTVSQGDSESTKWVTPSFSIDETLYTRFKKRFPRYGDASRVMRKLIEALLDGKVQIELKKRSEERELHENRRRKQPQKD
jgi:hypothetical protein